MDGLVLIGKGMFYKCLRFSTIKAKDCKAGLSLIHPHM